MADFSILGGSGIQTETFGTVAATSQGTVINPTVLETKSLYVELIASTSFEYNELRFHYNPLQQYPHLIDIAIGSAGNEEVIVPNLNGQTGSFGNSYRHATHITIPITIPKGSRIAVRSQTTVVLGDLTVSGIGVASSLATSSSYSTVTDMGTVLATSEGTLVDSGTTLNTKGAYAEIIASTAKDFSGFFVGFDMNRNVAPGAMTWLIDVAIGGSGSEEILIADYLRSATPADTVSEGYIPFYPIAIPAGTRIAIRAQCSSTQSVDRLFNAIVYGVA